MRMASKLGDSPILNVAVWISFIPAFGIWIPLVFLGTEIEFHEKGVKNGILDEEFPGVKDSSNSSQVENTI